MWTSSHLVPSSMAQPSCQRALRASDSCLMDPASMWLWAPAKRKGRTQKMRTIRAEFAAAERAGVSKTPRASQATATMRGWNF